MKRLITILYVLTVLLLLSSCTSATITPSGTTSVKPTTTTTAAITAKPTTSVSLPDPNGTYSEINNAADLFKEAGPAKISEKVVNLKFFASMRPSIADINTNQETIWLEKKTNVHINWEIPTAVDLTTNLNLSLASGNYPDMYFGISFTPAQTLLYAQQGILVPLNKYLDAKAPAYSKVLRENPDIKAVVSAPDGNVYSFARTDGGLHVRTQQKMYIFEPWLKKLGLKVPETTEEFKAFLKAVKGSDLNANGKNDEIPLIGSKSSLFVPSQPDVVSFLMAPFELTPKSLINVKDGKTYASFMTDAYKQGLAYIQGLYKEGLIAPDSFVQDTNQLKALVTKSPNQMLVAAAPGMYEGSFADTSAIPSLLDDFIAIKPLKGPEGKQQTIYQDFSIIGNAYMTSACKNPEIAVAWNDYWFTDEGALVNLMGFEGFTFLWKDSISINGKKPSFYTIYSPPFDSLKTQNMNWSSAGPRLQTSDLRYSKAADANPIEAALYQESLKYMDYMAKEHLPTTLWLTLKQATDLSAVESNIIGYVQEKTTQFITGKLNLDNDWTGYINELKAMGVDNWVKIYQEVFDSTKK